VIGVDLGGTKILAGVVDESGGVGRTVEVATPTSSQSDLVDALVGVVEELRTSETAAAGFGIPTRVDPKTGVAIAAVNGPSLERARRRGVTLPSPGFAAAIGVYPGGSYSLVNELVTRPLLILMGEADDWTLPGPCVEMVANMRRQGADASVVLYPGAVHYFDVVSQPRTYLPDVGNRNKPGECCGATVGYDAEAFVDARRRVEEFFGYHLGRK